MSIEIEATYENGILKLDRTLPLAEHQRVKVVIETTISVAQRSYGIIGWTGDPEVVRKMALDADQGVLESP
jgi:predicted DNA-binding antitoxin AbrB/MazE fold protein